MNLEQLAKTYELAEELGHAWELVQRGISYEMLSVSELPALLEHLREGRDFVVDELAFEFAPDVLVVKFLDDSDSVNTSLMVDAIKTLLSRIDASA